MRKNGREGRIILFVVLCLVAFLMALGGCRTRKGTLVTVASDIHVVATSLVEQNPEKYEDNHKMTHISEAVFHTFCDEVVKNKSEFLFLTGDLTENGDSASAQAVADILAGVEKKGTKVFVINGNHDVRVSENSNRLTQKDFYRIFREYGYSEAIKIFPGSLSYVAELDASHRLIAVDNIGYYRDDGTFKEEMDDDHRFWIYSMIRESYEVNKIPVVIAHKPFIGHFPNVYEKIIAKPNDQFKKLAEFFAENGVQYSFAGHMHANDINTKTIYDGDVPYTYNEVMTGCLPMYDTSYREMIWNGEVTEINTVKMTTVDKDYLPDYMSNSLKKNIKKNYNDYARTCLYTYIDKYIDSFVSENGTLSRQFKTDNSSLNALVEIIWEDVLQKMIETPLYKIEEKNGGTSMERILEEFGIGMFYSPYRNIYSLAHAGVRGLVAGNENFSSAFKNTVKYTVYEVFYFLNQARDKISAVAREMGVEEGFFIDVKKLYTEGKLDCYSGRFIPFILEIAKTTDFEILNNSIVSSVLDEMKKDMSILKRDFLLNMLHSVTNNIFVRIDDYFYEKEIDLGNLIEKGVFEQYIADFINDKDPGDSYLKIQYK